MQRCFEYFLNEVISVIISASWTWHHLEPPAVMEKLDPKKRPVLFFSDELCLNLITKLCILISHIQQN